MSILDRSIVVSFEVNGKPVELITAPNRTLVEVLREDLGLTGVKQGCDDSNCGVCTVIMDGKAVKSCCVLIGQAEGTKITTIEGLEGENGLHPIQQAFIDHFAIQCGYCTPGMILSAKALLDENPNATEEDIREALHGNICRCTGYKKIVEAIEAARDEINAQA
ncbi:MAG: (2Fe-2S)-binding protein [Lachnospiraceae bacterium]|nr:(2Fe-2S)-binding protein [Lachnospiraceae bacterium]